MSAFFGYLLLGTSFIAFQNCAGYVTPTHVSVASSVSGSAVCLSDLAQQGQTIYSKNCADCHGSFANSDKSGKTASDITNALATVSAMSSIHLSSSDIQALATALDMGPGAAASCATPTPAPSATATPASSGSTGATSSTGTPCTAANISAGQTLYAQNCASCHTALASSAKIGASFGDIQNGIATVPAMSTITLSATDLQNIAAALDAGTSTVATCGTTSGSSTSTTSSGTIANTPASATNFFACTPTDDPGVRDTKRLSKSEYLSTLTLILGSYFDVTSISVQTDLLPADAITTSSPIFDTTDNTLTANHLSAYMTIGSTIAGSLITNSQFLSDQIGCTAATGMTASCWTKFFNGFATLLFRRPLTSQEQSDYKTLFADPSLAGDFNDGLAVVLASLLNSPNFIMKAEVNGASVNGRTDLLKLSDYETASRLSFWITGHGPDAQLLADVAAGKLQTTAGYKAEVDRLFISSDARNHLHDFYNQWFSVLNMPAPGQTQGFLGSPAVASAVSTLKAEAAQEVLDFTDFFTWQTTGTYKDLITSTKSFTKGPALATVYGVQQSGGGSTQTITGSSMTASTGRIDGTSGWNLYSNGTLTSNVSLTVNKPYTVNVMAKADLAQNIGAAMTVSYGSQSVGSATVSATSYQVYSFTFTPTSASGVLTIAFTNDYYDQPTNADRNLYVQSVGLTPTSSSSTGDLPGTQRSGILTRAAMLIGSTDRSGLVHRGLLGRRNILCDPITPPVIPPGQASTFAAPVPDPVLSQREQISERTSPTQCQACHSMLNPMGFSLENYDSIGRYRSQESIFDFNGNLLATHPIDAGVEPNIQSSTEANVTGGIGMSSAIAASSKGPACMVKQYFVYTQQRMWTPADGCALNVAYSQLTDKSTASASGDTAATLLNMFKSTVYESSFRLRKVGPQ